MTDTREEDSSHFFNTDYLNKEISLASYKNEWNESLPFNHIIIDDFLSKHNCEAVVREFPNFDSDSWRIYNNAIEVKKLLNHWDKFGPETYKLFNYLNSREFISQLETLTECPSVPI